ncbi:hypothetical protein MHYP_G00200920 [Metynnis hypsauchen]
MWLTVASTAFHGDPRRKRSIHTSHAETHKQSKTKSSQWTAAWPKSLPAVITMEEHEGCTGCLDMQLTCSTPRAKLEELSLSKLISPVAPRPKHTAANPSASSN